MEKIFLINGQEVKVQEFSHKGDSVSFILNGKKHFYMLISKDQEFLILDNGGRFRAAVSSPNRDGDSMIFSNGREALGSAQGKKIKKSGAVSGGLKSPMPGKIFKILKDVGSQVKKGEPILILEAMKMEHSIRSDKDGTIKEIRYKVGELVQGGVTLAEVQE
jgi:3-methylcrotonyl-CoA carboxylase alpha subunit